MSLEELQQLDLLLFKLYKDDRTTSPLAKENVLWVRKYTQGKVLTYNKPRVV